MNGVTAASAARRSLAPAILLLAFALAGCGGGSKARPADAGSGASSSRVWSPGVPDTLGPTVAVIGTRRIRAHEVDSIIASAPPNIRPQLREPEGYRNLVDRMVMEEVLYQSAKRSGVEQDPEYRAALVKAARDAMMRMYYQRRVSAFPAPSDSAVQAYYESNQKDFKIAERIRIRHIQTSTRAKAEALRKRLASGGLWDALARSNSEDKATRENGGLLGFVSREVEYVPGVGKSPEIIAAAFQLKEGQTSRPLKSERGWHLIRVDQHEPERVQPLADVRQVIFGTLSTAAQEKHSQAFLDSLKSNSGAIVFEDSIAIAIVPARTPQDYFKAAQAAIDPEQRIMLYRDVVARFPDDPVSIQAQFMIGFTYAEELQQYDAARTELNRFIERYPRHELATSAKWMLENMDKPAPELDDAPEGVGGTGAPPDSLR